MTSDEQPRDLSRTARALLEAYRKEDELPVWVEERVHRKVFPRRSRPSKLAAFAFATAVAAAAAIVLWISHGRRPVDRASSGEANAASLHEQQGDNSHDARLRGGERPRQKRPAEPSDEPPSIGAEAEPAVQAPRAEPHRAGSRPSSGQPRTVEAGDASATDSGAGQLAREKAALDEVRQALAARRLDRAQAALERFRAAFPQAQLDDEAGALETMLACRRDPARAAELLRDFMRRNRESLFSHQVRSACVSW